MDRLAEDPIPLSTHNALSSRLLVVDDEPEIRSGLTQILNLEGYTADEAASGNEALSILKHNPYDLMLLDLHLPGLDGLQVMQQARQTWPELLIIILTGHATLESAIAAAKSDEVVDYLLKPASNEEILDAVHRALNKQVEKSSQQRLIRAAREILNVVDQPNPEPSLPPAPESPPEPQPSAVALPQFIKISPFFLDRKKRLVTLEGNPANQVELSKGEATVLASLMSFPDQILSCRRIIFIGWGDILDEDEAESVTRPYISRLRQKLEPNPKKPRFICTVRRRGYRFSPQ